MNTAKDLKDLIIFPAYNIGHSELLYFLKSLSDNSLLNKLLLICSRDFFTAYQTQVQYCIIDEFDSSPALVNKIESWNQKHRCTFKGIISIDEEMQFQLSKSIAKHLDSSSLTISPASWPPINICKKPPSRKKACPTAILH